MNEGVQLKPKKGYWQKPNNYVRVLTLLAVLTYTGFQIEQTHLIWESNVLSQRANISLSEIQLLQRDVGGVDVIPRWENTGNSTAEITSNISYAFSRDPLPDGFFLNERNTQGPSVPNPIGPHQVSTVDYATLPAPCLAAIKDGGVFRYAHLWGVARYNDELTGKPRITRFCWSLSGMVSGATGPISFAHQLCDRGNCIDKECEADQSPPIPRLPVDMCVTSTSEAPNSPQPSPPKN